MKFFLSSVLLIATLLGSHITRAKHLKYPEGYADKSIGSNRVVGGVDAPEGSVPYQVSLQSTRRDHFCGGSIIDANWILTASHCVDGSEPSSILVATGSNQWEHPQAIYTVDKVYTHCLFNQPGYHNDIALLRLNSSIAFNENTQPIALPTKQMKEGDEVILTGWGSTEVFGDTPTNLQMVKLKYLPHKKCKSAFVNDADDVDVGHICTFTREGEGACNGDSGGPLVSGGKLVGAVNWGYPCATGRPDVHASPLFYLDWIRRVMSGNTKCSN